MEFSNTLKDPYRKINLVYKRAKPYKKKSASNIKNKKILKLFDKITLYKQKQAFNKLAHFFKSK